MNGVSDQVKDQVWRHLRLVSDQIRNQVGNQIWDRVWRQVWHQVYEDAK